MGEHVGKRLVLWDIDKTLIDVDGIGLEIFSAAFAEYSGLTGHRDTRGPGRTEWRWFHDTLVANGVDPADDGFVRFLDVQDRLFDAREADMVERGRVLTGAEPILRHCADSSDIVSSLLTGNTRRNAERKLTAFGLHPMVDFTLGAYGDDHMERPELVSIARRRVYERTGIEFTAATTVLVGDSANDIRAAQEGGARIVAVATGEADAAELRSLGADTVLDDLSDTDAVLEALHG
ncbi:phosphoglycolate phosphatase-like HAD superfamily hydrolase [Nocardiopsis mwathae]|uniref:Phosphoglycolate phosphatase-like HAD superfamily hydrolase n=1 Tax=Nocardiopsis mwathae TaxID=1472723 RepID=A0A7X0D656_9ACTN|nr:haloacid dehalogenase-like hydrolase [Nocardiopsis mwathae]MBB6173162.1 phosphoglycolate phosphatase-like HAD superfamily hydrolase [Nocardiopsis mwathae]